MAFTAVIAIAGGAEVTAAVALAAVAEVGTAMTVVGMVTGNKTLMKVGGVMGLVGGIGGLAAGATGAAGGAAAEGGLDAATNPASVDAVNGMDSMSDSFTASGSTGAGGFGAGAAGDGLVDSAANLSPTPDPSGPPATAAPVATDPVTPTPLPNAAQTPAQAAATPSVTDVTTQTGNLGPQGVTAPTGAEGPASPYDSRNGMDVMSDNFRANGGQGAGGFGGGNGAPQTSSDFFDGFMKFANNNKQLMNTGTQLIGGALNGMNQRDMFDQKMALAQAQFQRANSVGSFAPTAFSPAGGIIGRAAQ